MTPELTLEAELHCSGRLSTEPAVSQDMRDFVACQMAQHLGLQAQSEEELSDALRHTPGLGELHMNMTVELGDEYRLSALQTVHDTGPELSAATQRAALSVVSFPA